MPKKTNTKPLTEEDIIRKQLFELPKDDIIKAVLTGIVAIFGVRCDYCVHKGECSGFGNTTEYSCGAGINEFLKRDVR